MAITGWHTLHYRRGSLLFGFHWMRIVNSFDCYCSILTPCIYYTAIVVRWQTNQLWQGKLHSTHKKIMYDTLQIFPFEQHFSDAYHQRMRAFLEHFFCFITSLIIGVIANKWTVSSDFAIAAKSPICIRTYPYIKKNKPVVKKRHSFAKGQSNEYNSNIFECFTKQGQTFQKQYKLQQTCTC